MHRPIWLKRLTSKEKYNRHTAPTTDGRVASQNVSIRSSAPVSSAVVPVVPVVPAVLPRDGTTEPADIQTPPPLSSTWDDVVVKGPTLRNTEKRQDDITDEIEKAKTAAITALQPVESVITAAGMMPEIEDALLRFAEGLPIFMSALDEVARIHPFINVVVLAFKAVYKLEMTRRDNDNKIVALYMEMKDMMSVLLELKQVKDVETKAPDGTTIHGRLADLAKDTAGDIEKCSNSCNTYFKRKIIVKVIQGPMWQARFLEFAVLFTKRRSEFQFALAIHTTVGVDEANRHLGTLDVSVKEVDEKMNQVLGLLEKLIPPGQRDLEDLIQRKGGPDAVKNEQDIAELLRDMPIAVQSDSRGVTKSFSAGQVLQEVKENIGAAEEKNLVVFSQKLELQQRQIKEDMERLVKRESDRVIDAVTSGPHDRIIDMDVHDVWKEMGWRGNVKARHFVLALRDHYNEKVKAQRSNGVGSQPHPDEWTLPYFNLEYLQPLVEAFDDDASGFISVAEVNRFTSRRPLGWSLPHWIAYWAVGFPAMMLAERGKVRRVFERMFGLISEIHPSNLAAAYRYLNEVWSRFYGAVESVSAAPIEDKIYAKFRPHVEADCARLKANLETLKWLIDEPETLALVAGPGRIEKYYAPLTRLLLERHLDIFRLCRTKAVRLKEFNDAMMSMINIELAFLDRRTAVESTFRHQRSDLDQRYQSFAFGFFNYRRRSSNVLSPTGLRDIDFIERTSDEGFEERDLKPEEILRYDFDEAQGLHYPSYEDQAFGPSASHEVFASSPLADILGNWNALFYSDSDCCGDYRPVFMRTITFQESADGHQHFVGSSVQWDGTLQAVTSGLCETSDGLVSVTFQLGFPHKTDSEHFFGYFDVTSGSISGRFSYGQDARAASADSTFVLKRTSARVLRFLPAPPVFARNRARAFWAFALSAVQDQVRRLTWSWSFFRDRRDHRRKYFDLALRDQFHLGEPLYEAEYVEYARCRQLLTPLDTRFYFERLKREAAQNINLSFGTPAFCDNCGRLISAARIICMDCETPANTIDLCDDAKCLRATITSWRRRDITQPHLSKHNMMKIRRVVHLRQYGHVYKTAKLALQRARGELQAPTSSEIPHSERIVSCERCRNPVSLPCWYCADCADHVFICDDCDTKPDVFTGTHIKMHTLVRCHEPENKAASMEPTIATLGENVRAMDERQAQMGQHVRAMEEHMRAMDARQARIEELLQSFVSKSDK